MRICTTLRVLSSLSIVAVVATAAEPITPTFKMHRVGNYRSEACGVGDFNNDEKLDIIAGPYLYLAPDWKKVKVRTLKGKVDEKGNGYMYDFMNAPLDVDGDGLLDVVSCSWHEKRSVWFRNTGPKGGEWPETVIEVKDNFEAGELWDVDGDGKRDEVVPATKTTVWYEAGKLPDGKPGMVIHRVSDKPLTWGVGVGDVNGDGLIDFLRPDAWFQAYPKNDRWRKHPLSLGGKDGKTEHTPQIWVYDVNDDGLNDIVTSSAHRYGIFWYEQLADAPDSGDRAADSESAHIATSLEINVIAVPHPDLCEISGGSDDGLKKGHVLTVYRRRSGHSVYVGRIKVASTTFDRSACKIMPEYLKCPMKRGDVVTSWLFDPPDKPLPSPRWKQHTIDDSWSQAHAITLADMDRDGDLDLVTGKRFKAHNGRDPGGNDPPGVYWYELKRGPKPEWKKHVVSFDQGIGSGMEIPVVDLDGDGDLDIVVTGKWGGPVWFENTGTGAAKPKINDLAPDRPAK